MEVDYLFKTVLHFPLCHVCSVVQTCLSLLGCSLLGALNSELCIWRYNGVCSFLKFFPACIIDNFWHVSITILLDFNELSRLCYASTENQAQISCQDHVTGSDFPRGEWKGRKRWRVFPWLSAWLSPFPKHCHGFPLVDTRGTWMSHLHCFFISLVGSVSHFWDPKLSSAFEGIWLPMTLYSDVSEAYF